MNELLLNESNASYHSKKDFLSSSVIKCCDKGWSAAKQMIDGLRPISTRALVTGSAFHLAVADINAFESKYLLAPEEFKTSTSQKVEKWAKDQDTTMEYVLVQSEWDNVVGMAKAVRDKIMHFRSGERWLSEPSFFVKDNATGCLLKAKPDILVTNSLEAPTLVDYIELKSARAVDEHSVKSAMYNLRYPLQQAFYERVICNFWPTIEVIRTRFIFVESKEPHDVRFFRLSPGNSIYCDGRVGELISEYRKRQLTGVWVDDTIDEPTEIDLRFGSSFLDDDDSEGFEEVEG